MNLKEMKYDLREQLKKYNLSQKEVYRTTTISIDKQNRIMEKGTISSQRLLLLHTRLGFDAPEDIGEYMLSNLMWSIKYSGKYLKDFGRLIGVHYADLKNWENSLRNEGTDRCLYEYKSEIDEFFADNGDYIVGLKDLPVKVGNIIPTNVFKLSLYVNGLKLQTIASESDSNKTAFYNKINASKEVEITKELMLPKFYEPILKKG